VRVGICDVTHEDAVESLVVGFQEKQAASDRSESGIVYAYNRTNLGTLQHLVTHQSRRIVMLVLEREERDVGANEECAEEKELQYETHQTLIDIIQLVCSERQKSSQ
jgi:hypothetical protein